MRWLWWDTLSNGKIGEEAYKMESQSTEDAYKVEIDNERTQAKEELKTGLTIGGILAILAFAL